MKRRNIPSQDTIFRDFHAIVQELQARQVELESQNEKLRGTQQALIQSEARFRRMYESGMLGVFFWNIDGAITDANDKYLEITGYSREDLLAGRLNCETLTPPEYWCQDDRTFSELKVHGVSKAPQEKEYIRKDGQRISIIIMRATLDEDCNKGVSFVLDITPQKQSAGALEESRQRYRSLVEMTSDFIWEVNRDGVYTYVSPRIYDLLGYHPEEVMGKTPFDLMPPKEAERVKMLFLEHIPQQSPLHSLENINLHKNGKLVTMETSGLPFYDTNGNFQGYRGIDRDITLRKQGEAALARANIELGQKVKERTVKLAESEEKYRLLVENASEAIIVAQDGRLKFFNNREAEITGYSAEELSTKPYIDIVHPDDRAMVMERYQARIRGDNVPSHYDVRIIHKNGNIMWLELNMVVITWEGQPAILGMMTDITQRKLLEQDLKEYAHRITQVQEEERKRIAYELHDDTVQYLAILKLQIDSLLQSGLVQSPEILEKLNYLDRDAARAVADVRRFSHELRPSVLDNLGLQAALEQIVEDNNKLKQVKVEFNVEGEEPSLSDEVKLAFFRMAQEALNNARKHSQAENAVISLEFGDNRIKMAVSDNGIGFDPQEAIVRSANKGSLGLMSLRERARLINADLRIASRPGHGTTVSVELSL